MVQAVVPGVIKQKFGTKAPLVMGWYISAIIAGAALTASLAAFWADWAQSWRVALSGWVVLSVVALLLWFSQKTLLKICLWCNRHKNLWVLPTTAGPGP